MPNSNQGRSGLGAAGLAAAPGVWVAGAAEVAAGEQPRPTTAAIASRCNEDIKCLMCLEIIVTIAASSDVYSETKCVNKTYD
jgi:hypothetical protein